MKRSRSTFWLGFTVVAAMVLMVYEMLALVSGIPQREVFALIRGMLEIPIPQIDTALGCVLAAIGAWAVTGMTYAVGKFILDKKDTVPSIGGFALGFGMMAAGVSDSSVIYWLPIAAAIGVATAYLSDKFASFMASEALSVGMAVIFGATAYMAIGHGLFVAAIVEFWLLAFYWLGVSAIVLKGLCGENDDDDYKEEYYRSRGQG